MISRDAWMEQICQRVMSVSGASEFAVFDGAEDKPKKILGATRTPNGDIQMALPVENTIATPDSRR